MSPEEIQDLLEKMNALQTSDGVSSIISASLMIDPIVSNKLAVELLQKVDRESKPEIVLSLPGNDSYFAYNVALSAWMKFGTCENTDDGIKPSLDLKKKDKVIIVIDTFNEDIAQKFIDYIESCEARPVAVLSLIGPDITLGKVPCLSLLH